MFFIYSISSWILISMIGIYTTYISISLSSWSPIIALLIFLVIAYIIGYIFYILLGIIQAPLYIFSSKYIYKEDLDTFLHNRVEKNIGIGFWFISVVFLLKSLLIFNLTFNYFIASGENFNLWIIFLIGLLWSLATDEEWASNYSLVHANLSTPFFYTGLFAINLSYSYLTGEEGRAHLLFVALFSLIALYIIITPIMFIVSNKMLNSKRAFVIYKYGSKYILKHDDKI